jgi:hypothetical protein
MTNSTFSRFVYCDTNIICHLAKNRHLWQILFDFFNDWNWQQMIWAAPTYELRCQEAIRVCRAR